MVVVVIDPALEEGGRPDGLNSSDESILDQDTEGVIHRLARNGTDVDLSDLGHAIGRDVGVSRYRPQHRQALGGDLDPALAKEVGRCEGHPKRLEQYLE